MIIKAKNLLTETAPKTYLSVAVDAAATVLGWKNYSQMNASWAIQVGKTGEEKTEVRLLGTDTPAGTAGTITAALTYDHPADTPIYGIKYDQVVFERSTDGTAGTASPMDDGTITIQADSEYTQFDDTSGSSEYGYRTYLKNSVLNVTTPESDWLTSAGLSFYSLGKIRDRVRRKILNSDSITDDVIDDWINEWLETMTNTAININEDYALGTTEISFTGTAQEATITAEDFKQVRRAWHTDTGSTWYRMTKQEFTNFTQGEIFSDANPRYYMKGDNVIGRNPHDTSGTIGLTYYKLNAVLDSDADTLPVAMRGYTRSFIQYATAQAKKDDNKESEAERLEAQAESSRQTFEQEMSSRNKSGPTYIDIVEGMPNDDIIW